MHIAPMPENQNQNMNMVVQNPTLKREGMSS